MSQPLDEIRALLGLQSSHAGQRTAAPPPEAPVAPLDEVRRRLGMQTPRPAEPAPELTEVLHRAGARPDELEQPYRLLLWCVAAVAALSVCFHHVVADAFADASPGWAQLAHTILTWPHPAVQPMLAGAAVVAIVCYGVITGGFRSVRPPDETALLAAAAAAVLAAGPLVVVCVTFVVVWALIIALVIVLVVGAFVLFFGNS